MALKDRIKYLAENKDKMDKLKEEMSLLKASIEDMKRRDIVAKKGGGPVARGNRMSEMEAGSKKAMGRRAGGYMKKKGYKSGGSISKPRGVGCAMRGYGKAMKG